MCIAQLTDFSGRNIGDGGQDCRLQLPGVPLLDGFRLQAEPRAIVEFAGSLRPVCTKTTAFHTEHFFDLAEDRSLFSRFDKHAMALLRWVIHAMARGRSSTKQRGHP